MNPLYVLRNIFMKKKNYFLKQKCHDFANLWNVLLNGRQLDSPISFYIQSVALERYMRKLWLHTAV